jgi:hypothetical protein
MSDFDYSYIITEDKNNEDDVVMTVNDYYTHSEIYEVCVPIGGTPMTDYVVVKDAKEDPSEKFYNVDYAL